MHSAAFFPPQTQINENNELWDDQCLAASRMTNLCANAEDGGVLFEEKLISSAASNEIYNSIRNKDRFSETTHTHTPDQRWDKHNDKWHFLERIILFMIYSLIPCTDWDRTVLPSARAIRIIYRNFIDISYEFMITHDTYSTMRAYATNARECEFRNKTIANLFVSHVIHAIFSHFFSSSHSHRCSKIK